MNQNEMMPGAELDQLVATKVMGWEIASTKASYRKISPDGGRDTIIMAHDFRPSELVAHAWEVVDKLAPLVGDFKSGDGFFHLTYADSADHSHGGCKDPARSLPDSDDDTDGERWSCHLHIGCMGADGGCPNHWDHGMKFCARGSTAPLAICRAALLATKGTP